MSAVVPDAASDIIVHLETTLGDVEYVVTFEDSKAASAFKKAVTEQSAKGEAEEVRKVRILLQPCILVEYPKIGT